MGHGHAWCCCGHGSCWPAWGLGKSWWPEPTGSKESEMTTKVDSFFPRPSTCAHLNHFPCSDKHKPWDSGSPVWIQMSRGEWRHLILLELDLLGPGRGCVYFGKGQTSPTWIPLPPKLVLGDDHRLSIFLTLCLAKQIVNAPRAAFDFFCVPDKAGLHRRFRGALRNL